MAPARSVVRSLEQGRAPQMHIISALSGEAIIPLHGLILGLPVDERMEGTAATVALSISGGADIVRVHDVKEMTRVVKMSDAIVRDWRPQYWQA